MSGYVEFVVSAFVVGTTLGITLGFLSVQLRGGGRR